MKYRFVISLELGAVLAGLSDAFVAHHYNSLSSIVGSRNNPALFADNQPDLDNSSSGDSADIQDDPTEAVSDRLNIANEYINGLRDAEEKASIDDDNKGTFEKSLEQSLSFDSEEKQPSSSMSKTTLQYALECLLQLAASTGRGEFATASQKKEAAEHIATLEGSNPTPEPTKSPMINGRWQLVYSSTQLFRSSPFFMAGRAVCTTDDQATQYDWFCDMHRKALAMSNIGQVRQVVSSNRIVSEFEVQAGAVPFLNDFTPFSYSGGLPVSIDGAIVSSADITPTDDGTAWELFMDTVQIKGSNIPGLRQILDGGLRLESRQLGSFLEQNVASYTNPRPVFKTTYLSETIRISRDQDGKVFVYAKESDDTAPTDYRKIDSDLGLLKLLEGFNDAVIKFYI